MRESRTGTPVIRVLGIGNVLWADEGFGVRAVEALAARWRFDGDVELIDGGTQGVNLVRYVEEADLLLVLDAIDYGLPPGTLRVLEGDAVPSFLGAKKMSLHQTGFQDVLAMAALLGRSPAHLYLVGVQPAQLEDYGGSLTPTVRACLEPAIARTLELLARHGVHGRRREDDEAPATEQPLGLAAYEAGRPPPELACRVGDERILRDPGAVFAPQDPLVAAAGAAGASD